MAAVGVEVEVDRVVGWDFDRDWEGLRHLRLLQILQMVEIVVMLLS